MDPFYYLSTRALLIWIWLLLLICHDVVLTSADNDLGWLRYDALPLDPEALEFYKQRFQVLCVPSDDTPILTSAQDEWFRGLHGLLGTMPEHFEVHFSDACRRSRDLDGLILELRKDESYKGYQIRNRVTCEEPNAESTCTAKTIVHATSDVGLLQGVFGLLRILQTNMNLDKNMTFSVNDEPKTELRIWNSMDYVNGGNNVIQWHELPDKVDSTYEDYARLLSSMGTNGISLSNVQHSCQDGNEGLLNTTMLSKVAMLAEIFGRWGIDLYLSPCLASPMTVGQLKSADPVNSEVKSWWTKTIEDLSARIPTLGGFLMQAGDLQDNVYNGCNHSVVANMLANALKPVSGVLIWRTSPSIVSSASDPAMDVYNTFQPYNGEFMANVILQIKVGPLEYASVRDVVSPLLAGMQGTKTMLELQVSTRKDHAMVGLASQWEYYLSQFPLVGDNVHLKNLILGVSGVSNFNNNGEYWGGIMGMANTYSWGRMAWDPYLTAEQVLDEWIQMTFRLDELVRLELLEILMHSWQVYENYTFPLGLATDCMHDADLEYCNAHYIHADKIGIGYDRTVESGSGFVGQYDSAVAEKLEHLDTCPESHLLFLHHVDWHYRLRTHKDMALIQYLYESHASGVRSVDANRLGLEEQLQPPIMDQERYNAIQDLLRDQVKIAEAVCNTMVSFFVTKSGISPKKSVKQLCDPEYILEEEEIALVREEREAAGIGFGLGLLLAIAGMIFTAYQVQEYPDGIYASICRVLVVFGGHIVRFITMPCRAICGKPHYHRQTGHMPIGQTDYQEPYNGQNGNFT